MKKVFLFLMMMPLFATAQINTFPWHEDFSTHNSGAGTVTNGWSCNSSQANVYSWRVWNTGVGTSSNTGPADDQGGDHKYIYTEATGYNTGDIAYITSPVFDVTILNNPELTFYYHMYGTNMGNLDVQIIQGGVTVTVATINGQQQASENDPWLKLIVDLSAYTGNIQVRFKGTRGNGYRSDISIDDVDIHEQVLCPGTTAETTSDILDISAKCNWTELGTAASWEIEYGPSGFALNSGTTISNILVEHHTINGLSPSTDYDWYVRSDCGANGNSIWAGPFSFTTSASLPWFEDFESLVATGYHILPAGMDATGDITSWHSFPSEPASSGDIYIIASGSGTSYLYSPLMNIIAGHSYDISFNYSVSGSNAASTWDIEVIKGNNKTGASMATVGNVANGQNNHSYLHFKTSFIAGSSAGTYFGIKMYSSSYASLYIDDFRIEETPTCPQPAILLSSNLKMNSADLSWTETGGATNWVTEWKQGSDFIPGTGTNTGGFGTSPNPTGTASNLNPSTKYYYYVKASCGGGDFSNWTGPQTFTTLEGKAENPIPADSAVPVAINATTLNWDDVPGADSYIITVGTTVGGNDIANAVACANSQFVNAGNWNYATRYYWTVTSVYNGGATVVSDEWNFYTECDIQSVFPFIEPFENGVPADCWFEVDVNGTAGDWSSVHTSPYLTGTNEVTPHSGNSMGRFNSYITPSGSKTRLESPSFDFTGIAHPEFSFWMFHDNTFVNDIDWIQIQVYTGGAWVNIGNAIIRKASYGSYYYKSWGKHTIDLTAYSGSIVKIGILGVSDSGMDMFIDDVLVEEAPICATPLTQNVSNIYLTSAKLSWMAAANTNQWDIEYGPQGFVQGTGTMISATNTNPYQLNNLLGATTYDWYIRTDCGGGSYSDWIGPHSFTTSKYQSSQINGVLTKCAPIYNRLDKDGTFGPLGEYFYDQFSFTVPVNGFYDITAVYYGYTGYLHLYTTSFDPDNPETNWIGGDDEGYNHDSKIEDILLSVGTTYIVVGTTEDPNVSNTFGTCQYRVRGASIANVPGSTSINGVAIGASNNVSSTDGVIRTANYECEDIDNWTHYYDDNGTATDYSDDNILLSVKKNGNNIGIINDGTMSVTLSGAAGVSLIQGPQAPYVQDPGGWYVYNRFWNLSPTNQPNSAVNVRYYYTDADFSALQNAINNDGGSVPQTHQSTAYFKINTITGNYDPNPINGHIGVPLANAYNADGCWIYENGNTASTTDWEYGTFKGAHFSELQIGHFSGGGGGASLVNDAGGSPLPISLVLFDAYESGDANTIVWTTYSESNTNEFIIERATDENAEFTPIVSLAAANNSNTPIDYSVEDNNPETVSYYRIRTVDLDGSEYFSKVISLNRNNMEAKMSFMSIFPNPTNSKSAIVYFSSYPVETEITVTNMMGETIYLKSVVANEGPNRFDLDLNRFQSGVYSITIRNRYSIITTKIIKK